jgi:hypothetical protein
MVFDSEAAISDGAQLAVKQINEAGGVEPDGSMFRWNWSSAIRGGTPLVLPSTSGSEDVIAVLGRKQMRMCCNIALLTVWVFRFDLGHRRYGYRLRYPRLIFRSRAAEYLQGAALADLLVNTLQFQQITTVQLDAASPAGGLVFRLLYSEPVPRPEKRPCFWIPRWKWEISFRGLSQTIRLLSSSIARQTFPVNCICGCALPVGQAHSPIIRLITPNSVKPSRVIC